MTTDERVDDRHAGVATSRRRRCGGPFDQDEFDRPDEVQRTDFGALLLPVPNGGVVNVEPSTKGKLQAVHISLPEGRLSVSALAAPTSGRLWPELAKEINTSLRAGGARVRSFQGRWGRELRARTGAALSVFVGIDGPRWMVYGVATGPAEHARALDRELRRVLGETVVARGGSPYPVRTVLPLTLPEHLQAEQDARAERAAAAAAAVQAQTKAQVGTAETEAQVGTAETEAQVGTAETEAQVGTAETEATPAPTEVAVPVDPPTVEFPIVAPRPARPAPMQPPPPAVPMPEPLTQVIPAVRPPVPAVAPPPVRPVPAVRPPVPAVAPRSPVPAAAPRPPVPAAAPRPPVPAAAPRPPVRPVVPVSAEPALAFLMADPMDLFAAASPGRHRRDD